MLESAGADKISARDELDLPPAGLRSLIEAGMRSVGATQSADGLKIFISHSSKDRRFVSLLVELLRNALTLSADQVRCTSIDGYRLPGGANTDETLRNEVERAETFVGIVSKDSLQSLYVLFELGARWGVRKHLIPVLAPGASASVMGGPLAGFSSLSGTESGQLHQLVVDLGKALGVSPQSPAAYQAKIAEMCKLASGRSKE
jgi:hypothetical protein